MGRYVAARKRRPSPWLPLAVAVALIPTGSGAAAPQARHQAKEERQPQVPRRWPQWLLSGRQSPQPRHHPRRRHLSPRGSPGRASRRSSRNSREAADPARLQHRRVHGHLQLLPLQRRPRPGVQQPRRQGSLAYSEIGLLANMVARVAARSSTYSVASGSSVNAQEFPANQPGFSLLTQNAKPSFGGE